MIKTDVPMAEADAMAADGSARVLERVNVPGEGVLCTVWLYEEAAPAEEPAPKPSEKRNTKRKS